MVRIMKAFWLCFVPLFVAVDCGKNALTIPINIAMQVT